MDEEAAVHSSPVAEVVSVHSPASPDLSERAFSEPPERPEREGRLRVRPRILKPPSDLPPGTYPTVRVDRQGIWVLVSPAPAPPTSGVRDAEEVREAPAPIPGAADLDPYELPQAVWQDLAQAYAARPPSLDLATAPVVSDRPGERTEEGLRLGVGAFRAGEVIEARPLSPARSRSPRQPKEGAAPSAPSRIRTSPAPPAPSTDPAPPSVPIAAASSPASPAPLPPPSVPWPPPAVRPPPATGAPTAAKGPPPKTAPTPPPQWAKEQAARRQEAEAKAEAQAKAEAAAKAKAAELASGSAESPSHPEQGAHTIGAADRSRSPKVKAPPPGLDAKPVAYKAPPTARLREEQAREREAQAEAKAKEAQAQRLRDEAAAKPSTPAAPRLVGQRAPLSIVLDWHKTLDLGYDSRRGTWGERTLQAFRQLNQAHRPLVFRVLSFTGRQQAEAHRQEAFNALPSLERGAGITISSFDQCFERINRGGKAELLHGLGPTAGQQPGAHYIVDDNRDIIRESRRTGCKAILVQKAGRYYEETDLIDALRALSESLQTARDEATGAQPLQQSQYLEVVHR